MNSLPQNGLFCPYTKNLDINSLYSFEQSELEYKGSFETVQGTFQCPVANVGFKGSFETVYVGTYIMAR